MDDPPEFELATGLVTGRASYAMKHTPGYVGFGGGLKPLVGARLEPFTPPPAGYGMGGGVNSECCLVLNVFSTSRNEHMLTIKTYWL